MLCWPWQGFDQIKMVLKADDDLGFRISDTGIVVSESQKKRKGNKLRDGDKVVMADREVISNMRESSEVLKKLSAADQPLEIVFQRRVQKVRAYSMHVMGMRTQGKLELAPFGRSFCSNREARL